MDRDPTSKLIARARKALGRLNIGHLLRARAALPAWRSRPFLIWQGRTFTYADTYREAQRFAALFRTTRHALVTRGKLAEGAALPVGIYRDNAASFVFAVLGAALEGDVVVALNTGFRGDTLATLLDRTEVRLLLTNEEQVAHVEPLLAGLRTLGRDGVIVEGERRPGMRTLDDALAEPARGAPRRPDGNEPLLVIYTSGTTGVPKAIGCSQFKLLGSGVFTSLRIGLRPRDRGYVCMPLYHSNAWFLAIMPLLLLGGSFVLTQRFSASAFEDDILEHGVTYMNYVGQPLHYILHALEKRHGSAAAVRAALASHPKNRFRIAHGNGAPPADREKLVSYLGMEHVYGFYGSTESVINTLVKPGDPPDSVGRIWSRHIVILNEHGQECPPADVDRQGRILNYDQAVGEICAQLPGESLLFDGYFGDAAQTQRKYRGGHYHSGDLGHVRLVRGKRYLYFDGRTDDWIRKDGENFSAESVARFALELPAVELAAAYGVPAPVSDDVVAVALQLREGSVLDPGALHAHFLRQQREGGMDPKWMPDFVRVVDALPMTTTNKIVVRQLKREHYDLSRHPEMLVYWRRRGDDGFRRFTPADYEALRAELTRNGRAHLLEGSGVA